MSHQELNAITLVRLFILVFLFLDFASGLQLSYPKCRNPLGMESGEIHDVMITASSHLDQSHSPDRARLNLKSAGGWTPRSNDPSPWIEVYFTIPITLTIVATQGHSDSMEWVKTFSLQYNRKWGQFFDYENGLVLTGNNDQNTAQTNILKQPLKAIERMRIVPKSWNGSVSLRFELYGCTSAIVGFRDAMASVSEKAGHFPFCVTRRGLPHVPLNVTLNVTTNANILKAPSLVTLTGDPLYFQTCFNLTIHDNNVLDHSNAILLTLRSDDINVFVSPNEMMINILDDDEASIGFKKTFLPVDENAGNVPVCVFMHGIVAGPISFNFTSDSNAIKSPSSVTLTAYQKQICFDMIIQDNNILEYNKTAHLTILSVDHPRVLINETQKQLKVFIRDDDQVTIQFKNDTVTVEEDVEGGKVDLALVMNGVTDKPFDVKLVVNQDGADTAKEGEDFNIMTKNVIFTHEKHQIIIHAYIEDDDEVEKMEFFTVKIIVPTETRAVVGNPSEVLVKIEDSADIEKAKTVAAKLESEESNEEKSSDLLMTILVVTGSFFGIALTIAVVLFVMNLRDKKKQRTEEFQDDDEP